jgi:hypothetical protein
VAGEVADRLPHHVGGVWEDLARASVPRLGLFLGDKPAPGGVHRNAVLVDGGEG